MAQQHINYSQPGDHLGDTLRTSQVKAESNFTELYNNKVDKETGKSLTDNNFSDADKAKLDGLSNDAVTQSDWLEGDNLDPAYIKNKPENLSDFFNDLPQYLNAVGSFHYSDLATQTVPLSVTAGVEKKLTNDTLGPYTNVSNAPFGVSTLWNPATNQFDFSQLAIGDLVKLRPDLNINLVGTNTSYKLYMKMAIGSTIPWTLTLLNSERKSTDEFNDAHLMGFDIGNTETKDYPAEIYILTDAGADVKVNGWYIEVVRRNINIIDIAGEVPLATSLVTGTVKTDITEADPIVYTKATVDDLLDGVVHKTGDETIFDGKIFTDSILTDRAVVIDNGVLKISNSAIEDQAIFKADLLTNSRDLFLPDKSGVIALDVDLLLKANADGTILYHSVKWFTPSSTVSNVGATVTSVGTQFTSAMVGAKLDINGEKRIITAFTSSTVVTVDSAYSVNNTGVVAGSWGVYNKAEEIKSDGSINFYKIDNGNRVFSWDGGQVRLDSNISLPYAFNLAYLATFNFSSNNNPDTTKDVGYRRNASGILEIYNGVTADGTLTNRRDLLLRNLLATKALIGTAVDNGVDALIVNGTVSGSPATLSNQFVTKGQLETSTIQLAYKSGFLQSNISGAISNTNTVSTANSVIGNIKNVSVLRLNSINEVYFYNNDSQPIEPTVAKTEIFLRIKNGLFATHFSGTDSVTQVKVMEFSGLNNNGFKSYQEPFLTQIHNQNPLLAQWSSITLVNKLIVNGVITNTDQTWYIRDAGNTRTFGAAEAEFDFLIQTTVTYADATNTNGLNKSKIIRLNHKATFLETII